MEVEAQEAAATAAVALAEAAKVAARMAVGTMATAAKKTTAASNLFTQTRPMARPHQGTQNCTRHRRKTMVSSALLEFYPGIRTYAFLMSSASRTRP